MCTTEKNPIDNIVIVACGKGTRLKPLTTNIPKILVNINNDNIINKILNYWSQYCNNFIIIIESEFNTLVEFYLKQKDNIKYEIRNLEINNNEENSYTISHTLTDCDGKNLLLTWCDLFPREDINFSKILNNCIFTNSFSNYNSRYYAEENKTIIKMTNYSKGNIVGIYYIKNFKRLIYKTPYQDLCDCFIDNYKEFQTYELDNIVDIGDFEKFNKLIISNIFPTRFFNEIKQISSNKLIKKSINAYGDKVIKDEIKFYKFLQENKIEYPIIKIDNIGETSFEMDYIKNPTVYESIKENKNPEIIKKLLIFLNNLYLKNIKNVDYEIILNDLQLDTVNKIIERNNLISSVINDYKYISYVNGVKIDSYENIMEKLNLRINKFTSKSKNLFYNICHGDLNLSNIFISDDNNFIFIDPRGKFGDSDVYGLKYYELSKIYFSLFGFDAFNSDSHYYFNITGNNISSNISNLIDKIYIFKDVFTLDEYEFIITIAVSIWLGLPYYFKNNISKMIGAYFHSLYLGTIYLDSIDNLIKQKYIKEHLNNTIIINKSELNDKILNENSKAFKIVDQPFKTYRNLVVKKPWGFEFVSCEMENLTLLVLHLKNNQSTSLHTHFLKDTPMILAQGKLTIETVDNEYKEINVGDIIILNRKTFHKLRSHSDDTIILEWEMIKPNKNDLFRLKDDYSRENKGYENKNNTIYDARNNCTEYFEYYPDSPDLEYKFLNNTIYFKKNDLHISIKQKLINNNTIIVILKGYINLEGKYLKACSIFRGSEILNKFFICEGDDFRYFLFN